jgi:hypothetical protein
MGRPRSSGRNVAGAPPDRPPEPPGRHGRVPPRAGNGSVERVQQALWRGPHDVVRPPRPYRCRPPPVPPVPGRRAIGKLMLDEVTTSDAEIAAALALGAGEPLRQLRRELAGPSPADLEARGDAEAQRVLAAGLAAARPFDAVLSEETTDYSARRDASRVWIIDPLDGTREYSEGRSDRPVHVALWLDGALVAGALPGLDTVLTVEPAPVVPPRDADAPLLMAVSRSRPPAIATGVAEALGADAAALQPVRSVPARSGGVPGRGGRAGPRRHRAGRTGRAVITGGRR